MRANKTIKFMVTEEQFQRIRNKAVAKGFVTVSEYLRDVALALELSTEEKVEKLWREYQKSLQLTGSPKEANGISLKK